MDIFLNKLVQFYLNNTINLRRLSQRIISCCTHKMAIVSWPRTMWRHITLCICAAGSMLGRAFVCLSVCLSRRSTAATYGCRRVCWREPCERETSIDSCSAAGAGAQSSKCGQRHVNSRRRRLSTDLIPTNVACRYLITSQLRRRRRRRQQKYDKIGDYIFSLERFSGRCI